MKVIIYTNENGNVDVCIPTGELTIEEVQAKDTPAGSIIVDHEDLPNEDDVFFDAWVLNGNIVSVDIAKAKEITKTRLRREREPLLKAQDVLFMRNLELGLDNSAVVAEKQRLRDITILADSCTTTAELRALEAK